jgi:hypothetical protein
MEFLFNKTTITILAGSAIGLFALPLSAALLFSFFKRNIVRELLHISALPLFNLMSLGSFKLASEVKSGYVYTEDIIAYSLLLFTSILYVAFSIFIIISSTYLSKLKIAAVILNGIIIILLTFVSIVLWLIRYY